MHPCRICAPKCTFLVYSIVLWDFPSAETSKPLLQPSSPWTDFVGISDVCRKIHPWILQNKWWFERKVLGKTLPDSKYASYFFGSFLWFEPKKNRQKLRRVTSQMPSQHKMQRLPGLSWKLNQWNIMKHGNAMKVEAKVESMKHGTLPKTTNSSHLVILVGYWETTIFCSFPFGAEGLFSATMSCLLVSGRVKHLQSVDRLKKSKMQLDFHHGMLFFVFLKQAPARMEIHGKVVQEPAMSKYIIYTYTHAMIVHSVFTPQ